MSTDLLMIDFGKNKWIEVYDDWLVIIEDKFLSRCSEYKIDREQINRIYESAKRYGWFEKNKTWVDTPFHVLKEDVNSYGDNDYDYYESLNIKSYGCCYDFADIYPDYIVIGNEDGHSEDIYYIFDVPKFREIIEAAKEVGLINVC